MDDIVQGSPLISFAPKFFNGIGADAADIPDLTMMFSESSIPKSGKLTFFQL